MPILELRILPPIAIGRLGSSPTPLDAFDLEIAEDRPLDYRRIIPRPTLQVNESTGAIAKESVPQKISFKDADGLIRPVAPFLEVFARTDAQPDELVPLTLDLLKAHQLRLNQLSWQVEVGNLKMFRRTGQDDDKISARIDRIADHKRHPLEGICENFLPGKKLPLGWVQFIKPTKKFPQVRLRFTPAAGKVYGSSRERIPGPQKQPVPDCIIDSDALVLYDKKRGWWNFEEGAGPTITTPGAIFAGYDDTARGVRVSWGYLDDECDGFVSVTLQTGRGKLLTARAVIGAGPPTFAPDTLPIRVVSDELEQILLGPDVEGDVSLDEAEELVRRALETVRLMNTAVMNGNPVNGRLNVASTMVRQDTADFGRLFEPIMDPSLMDNLAVVALHERILNGLSSGGAPWFSEALRRPEEIGDLSNQARRKMPALMRNADGRALTLTHRQINTVIKAAAQAMFQSAVPAVKLAGEPAVKLAGKPAAKSAEESADAPIHPANLTAQLHYRGTGNPLSVLARTAISNCFPGLEFDFRNLWRRAFEGVVLLENNNYVVEADAKYASLIDQRLVRVDGRPTMVVTTGPVFPGGDSKTLATAANPSAVAFMEWSNSLAHVLTKQGQVVECEFTDLDKKETELEVLYDEKLKTQKVKLRVRTFFDEGTAAIAADLLRPGELTQGLCSPWQNDYRECACYYWAASRPDYVNVEPGPDGLSRGDVWTSKSRTGSYIADDRADSRLVSYDDLFKRWESELRFVIRGRDEDES